MNARPVLAGLLAVAATLSVGYLTRVPVGAPPDHALLRLAWRSTGIRVETCRPLTEEERETIPQHMQQEEICEGHNVPFRLTINVDDETRRDVTVQPAGARGDRPIYVLETLRLAPGRHRVSVLFEPTEVPAEVSRDSVSLRYEQTLSLDSGHVGLLTLSSNGSRLELRGYGVQ